MKVVFGVNSFKKPASGSVITIGVFDGVHIGHAKLIQEVVRRARRNNLKSVVLTFEPHPVKVLRSRSYFPRLVSLSHRLKLIEKLGVDTVVVLNFTRSFSRITPEEFVKKIALGKLNCREICVSPKFYFGRGGRAGVKELRKMAESNGIKVTVIPPVKVQGVTVGSSMIRRLVLKGDIHKAARFLGRPVSILGTIVSGSQLGRTLGYPTANINPHHEVVPPSGVYAIRIKVGGRIYRGVLNIGTRPTFYAPRDSEPTIEAHIFNFKGSIYGSTAEVYFVDRIRNEVKYKDRLELVRQIKKDEALARNILS